MSQESLDIIMQKVEHVADNMLELIESELKQLNIQDQDMLQALKYAISTKMQEKMHQCINPTK